MCMTQHEADDRLADDMARDEARDAGIQEARESHVEEYSSEIREEIIENLKSGDKQTIEFITELLTTNDLYVYCNENEIFTREEL